VGNGKHLKYLWGGVKTNKARKKRRTDKRGAV
jgi:hypothetical protein